MSFVIDIGIGTFKLGIPGTVVLVSTWDSETTTFDSEVLTWDAT